MSWGLAQGADLSVRLDAREIVRNHVHTELTLAVKSGPLTLVFPKWLPGEHMPSGPLDTLVGMSIRANGQPLTWQRDPKDPFAVSLTVPAGVSRLEIALDSGLPTEGGSFTAGPTSSAQLAVLSWNQYVLLPKGRDAATLSTVASLRAPPQWQVAGALAQQPQADGSVRLEEVSLARLIDSPVQIAHYARRIDAARRRAPAAARAQHRARRRQRGGDEGAGGFRRRLRAPGGAVGDAVRHAHVPALHLAAHPVGPRGALRARAPRVER